MNAYWLQNIQLVVASASTDVLLNRCIINGLYRNFTQLSIHFVWSKIKWQLLQGHKPAVCEKFRNNVDFKQAVITYFPIMNMPVFLCLKGVSLRAQSITKNIQIILQTHLQKYSHKFKTITIALLDNLYKQQIRHMAAEENGVVQTTYKI